MARQPLASRQEVAEHLRVPVQTLAVWAHKGIGPRYIKIGVHARYRWEDVEQWLAQRERAGAPAA